MKQLLSCGPGLVIGIPTLGRPVPLDWALALKSMNTPINYNVNFNLVAGRAVDEARNMIAEYAIEKDAKYLFFLGDDVVCPSHTLKQLIFRMEQDPSIGVVGGVYCSKCEPSAPLVFRGNGQGSYWDWKVGEFFEVTGLGLDCNLIRVDLLKKLKKNWFKTVEDDQFLDGINNAESWTEDLYFYKRVLEETSYKIFCDSSVMCEHWDVYGNKKYTLPADSLPMRQKKFEKDKRCLMIGPPIQITEIDQFDITFIGSGEGYTDYRTGPGSIPFAADIFDWVIVTETGFNTDVEEYLRVMKPDGKLTLQYSPLIYNERVLKLIPHSKVDGPFIEVRKNVSS